MGNYLINKEPFSKVYVHALVRDEKGQKMSKSKGNVISPLEISDQYGTDALRMGLVVGNTPGTALNLDPKKIEAYKKFANKLWNISRFVLSQENTGSVKAELKDEFEKLALDVTKDIDNDRIHLASEKIYHYVWGRFASEILEESKGKEDYGATLHYLLGESLKLVHPFMPFVTEAIWQRLPKEMKESEFLMIAKWPAVRD